MSLLKQIYGLPKYLQGIEAAETKLTGYGCSTLLYCKFFQTGRLLACKKAGDDKVNNMTNA